MRRSDHHHYLNKYARRVWTVAGIATATAATWVAVWYGIELLLLIYAGLLLALALSLPTDALSRHTFVPRGWSLVIVVLLILGVLAAFFLLFSSHISQQLEQLAEVLPGSLAELEKRIRALPFGARILDLIATGRSGDVSLGQWFSDVASIFSSTLGALINILIVLFIGLYVAIEPDTYRAGLLHLVSPARHDAVVGLLRSIHHELSRWLLGQLISMTIVGVLTGLGLWLLGIPLAFSLGLLAGLLEFIPNIGPILAAIPALLVGFSLAPHALVEVIVLYLVIQTLESYLITPFVMRETVKIPPALLLAVQVGLSLFAGMIGLLVAAPLIALFRVLVKRIYVEGWLGGRLDRSSPTPP